MNTSVIYWSMSSFAVFCYALSLFLSLSVCVCVCTRVRETGGRSAGRD